MGGFSILDPNIYQNTLLTLDRYNPGYYTYRDKSIQNLNVQDTSNSGTVTQLREFGDAWEPAENELAIDSSKDVHSARRGGIQRRSENPSDIRLDMIMPSRNSLQTSPRISSENPSDDVHLTIDPSPSATSSENTPSSTSSGKLD
ncbi:hypothetical protein AMATHDRAFT_71160 [Amanita thiersii Skay4041]|uniref:Uncharacterized protein n=1 Tax=Amanita thiersii Skay4041 TaxID=703135 RepID=A0A2A9NDE4_9AGAR|nr:hypothetical protein AMATHDRAFT_71160 [Amanita thiersii Skay4041]